MKRQRVLVSITCSAAKTLRGLCWGWRGCWLQETAVSVPDDEPPQCCISAGLSLRRKCQLLGPCSRLLGLALDAHGHGREQQAPRALGSQCNMGPADSHRQNQKTMARQPLRLASRDLWAGMKHGTGTLQVSGVSLGWGLIFWPRGS